VSGPITSSSAIPADRRRQLAESILAASRRAGLRPGSQLPTERQLAQELGTTRTSVRHALAVLEADGFISREIGRGTFLRDAGWPDDARAGRPGGPAVADHSRTGDGDSTAGRAASQAAGAGQPAGTAAAAVPAPGGPAGSAGFAPADVMTIRRLIEPAAMHLVVAWATAADFAEIERCLAGGDRADGYEEFEIWDLALHRSIMVASQSPLLVRLYGVIEDARHGQSWGDLKRRSASAQRQQDYQADHLELVTALRARDADRATEAMRAHLARVTSYLFGPGH
jgi:DNA-binding FadR family transcriptional regulator